MNKRLPYIVFIALLLAFASLQASPPIGAVVPQDEAKTKLDHEKLQKPSKNSATPPKGDFQDTQIELAPDQDRRRLRENRYKGANAEIKDPADTNPTGPPEDYNYTFIDFAGKVDPLPASQSTAVVIGTVLNGKAHVSKDHTFVYSDYQIKLNQILKQDPSGLTVGDVVVAMRQGGTIRFPSGHVRHFITSGHGFPVIGAQYLIFLLKPDAVEYEMAIGATYELRSGRVYPLDDVSNEFEGASEPDFLSKVQTAIAQKGGKP